MARVHGKDISTLTVDDSGGSARSLLADTISFGFPQKAAVHDTTTMGDDDMEFTAGLKHGATFTHEVFYNNTASTGTDAVYSGRVGVLGTFSWSDGTTTYSIETIVTDWSINATVGDMVKGTATHQQSGSMTRA